MKVGGVCAADFKCSHFGVGLHGVFDSTAATLEDEIEEVSVMIFAFVDFVEVVFFVATMDS